MFKKWCFLTSLCLFFSVTTSAQEIPLGAWKLVQSLLLTQDSTINGRLPKNSLLNLGTSRYFMAWSRHSEFYENRFQPSDQEALDRYKKLLFNAWRYDIEADTLTINPEIALVPEFEAGLGKFVFEVKKDSLQLIWVEIRSADKQRDPYIAQGIRFKYTFVKAYEQ